MKINEIPLMEEILHHLGFPIYDWLTWAVIKTSCFFVYMGGYILPRQIRMTTGIVRIQVLTNLDFIVHVMMLGCCCVLRLLQRITTFETFSRSGSWIGWRWGTWNWETLMRITSRTAQCCCTCLGVFMKNSEWIDFEQEWINTCTYINYIYTLFFTHTYIHIYIHIFVQNQWCMIYV